MLHHQIRLRILSCGRMSENHREPEVPEEKVPVVECLDGLARITSKELVIPHFVKSGTLQNACSTWRPRGVKVPVTPVGSDEFVQEVSDARLEEERKLWNAMTWMPDLQCAWQVLLQCTGPRCHHFLRTMPPSKSMEYAQGHDREMLRSMEAILGSLPGNPAQNETAHTLPTLPMRMEGLGLRSAVRMAPAAFWASWADARSMTATRLPQAATSIVHRLTNGKAIGWLFRRIARGRGELGPSSVRFTTRLGCIEERSTTTSHDKR